MMIRLYFLLPLTFIFLPFYIQNSYAKDEPYCDSESGQSDNLRRCAYQSLDIIDKNLNIIYQHIMKQLSPVEQSQLKKSERQWIQRKGQDCYSPEALKERGTTTDIDCGADKTINRILYLTMYEICHQKSKNINMIKDCLSNQYQLLDAKLNKNIKKE